MARLAAHFPANRTAEQWDILFEDYADRLQRLEPDNLCYGVSRALEECRYFPTLGEILKLCEPPAIAGWSEQKWQGVLDIVMSGDKGPDGRPYCWDEAELGPPPGTAGCRVPEALVTSEVREFFTGYGGLPEFLDRGEA